MSLSTDHAVTLPERDAAFLLKIVSILCWMKEVGKVFISTTYLPSSELDVSVMMVVCFSRSNRRAVEVVVVVVVLVVVVRRSGTWRRRATSTTGSASTPPPPCCCSSSVRTYLPTYTPR